MKQNKKKSRAPESSVLDYDYHSKSSLAALHVPWPAEADNLAPVLRLVRSESSWSHIFPTPFVTDSKCHLPWGWQQRGSNPKALRIYFFNLLSQIGISNCLYIAHIRVCCLFMAFEHQR